MTPFIALAALCALPLLGALAPAALAAEPNLPAPSAQAAAGQKLDSGLGDLPHYRYWADRTGRTTTAVVGESLDSGLGQLPHYATWKDKSGRDPMRTQQGLVLTASR